MTPEGHPVKYPSSRLAVLAVAAGLLLAGCSSDGSDGSSPSPSASASTIPTPTAADVAAVEAVKVTGDPGAAPTVTFTAPFTVTAPTARLDTPGTGDAITDGQTLAVHMIAYSGKDASKLGDTWSTNTPQSVVVSKTDMWPALYDVLHDQKVGTRFVLALPSDGKNPVMVYAGEVASAKTVPTRAEGTPVEPAPGLPTVTLDDTGKPSITIPDGYTAPTTLVAQTLIKGTGPVVTADQTITAHYTGWLLDGKQFDSSWDRGKPFTISLQNIIAGWAQGLAGQTVGSQVLLVIPPDLAYGSTGKDPIPPNSPLVFVVDILDATATPTQ